MTNPSPVMQDTIDRYGDRRLTYGEALRALTRSGLRPEEARLALGNPPAQEREHPLVTGARKRLDSIEARSRPGLPLHYVMQRHIYACAGCGAHHEAQVLLECRRVGAGGKAYAALHPSARIYDLPVDHTRTEHVTPRCDACFDALPREALPPMPEPQARLIKRTPAPVGDVIDLDALFAEDVS